MGSNRMLIAALFKIAKSYPKTQVSKIEGKNTLLYTLAIENYVIVKMLYAS